ncbi:MAG: DNA ligase [Actinophytocola sp.]|nr:DNA ligase [Actinophytocola sp.]
MSAKTDPAPGKLAEYRRKRDPGRTPEPVAGAQPAGNDDTFVIQEHHARHLHWDVRLERDGVLVSWAVPKGLPHEPGSVRLAVHTEDHPLEYAGFEGEIPKGEYGAGQMLIWDRGSYETLKWSSNEVEIDLRGKQVQGRYVFFRRGDEWLVRRSDPPQEPDWEPLPKSMAPMLAVKGDLPPAQQDDQWGYEFKWDGVRALGRVDGGRLQLYSRRGGDITRVYPELQPLGEELVNRQLWLDGEVVALRDGKPSFAALQSRMHALDSQATRLSRHDPVTYLIFDLLHLDGHSCLRLPYRERRDLLDSLELDGDRWRTSPTYPGQGAAVLAASREQQLEGAMAKRLDAPYRPGKRSGDWIKITDVLALEVVIGGWRPGEGRRAATFGSLLLGVPEDGGLRYVGHVGTGFSEDVLRGLRAKFNRLERKASPFTTDIPRDRSVGARWLSPKLVGEVVFREWTADRRLRAPAWRGLRPDRDPADIHHEDGS